MSVVGHKIWMHMQEHRPRYTQAGLARDMKEVGFFVISSQSISNYLRREHPPVDFVTAVIDFLGLTEDEEQELRELYFRGNRTDENNRKIEKKREEFRQRSEEKRRKREDHGTGDPV